ncbi:MAG: hypothetical protein J6K55_12485 [Clostridia bacterium]|nr:hypothetical protein [Clostridia bacterium]
MKKPEAVSIYKEETAPACCLTCGHYRPQFYRVQNKECAAFGTTKGVKWERCGAWCKRVAPPSTG